MIGLAMMSSLFTTFCGNLMLEQSSSLHREECKVVGDGRGQSIQLSES